jgi:hypothetical protein
MLTTLPLLVPRSRKSRSYTSSPPSQAPLWSVTGPLLPLRSRDKRKCRGIRSTVGCTYIKEGRLDSYDLRSVSVGSSTSSPAFFLHYFEVSAQCLVLENVCGSRTLYCTSGLPRTPSVKSNRFNWV